MVSAKAPGHRCARVSPTRQRRPLGGLVAIFGTAPAAYLLNLFKFSSREPACICGSAPKTIRGGFV